MKHRGQTLGGSWAALALAIVLAGCGSQIDGPPRYRVSGEVTYDGQPVPRGFITFEPDSEKGNSGPGGGAEIKDGRYRTDADMGVIGGPHRVRIIGYDGVPTTVEGEELADGQPLFPPYETQVDFPKEDTTHDFTIPKSPPQ